jgi:hypothetical protein
VDSNGRKCKERMLQILSRAPRDESLYQDFQVCGVWVGEWEHGWELCGHESERERARNREREREKFIDNQQETPTRSDVT